MSIDAADVAHRDRDLAGSPPMCAHLPASLAVINRHRGIATGLANIPASPTEFADNPSATVVVGLAARTQRGDDTLAHLNDE